MFTNFQTFHFEIFHKRIKVRSPIAHFCPQLSEDSRWELNIDNRESTTGVSSRLFSPRRFIIRNAIFHSPLSDSTPVTEQPERLRFSARLSFNFLSAFFLSVLGRTSIADARSRVSGFIEHRRVVSRGQRLLKTSSESLYQPAALILKALITQSTLANVCSYLFWFWAQATMLACRIFLASEIVARCRSISLTPITVLTFTLRSVMCSWNNSSITREECFNNSKTWQLVKQRGEEQVGRKIQIEREARSVRILDFRW